MKRRKCFVQVAFKEQDNKVVYVLLLRAKNGKYAFPTFSGGFKYHRGHPKLFGIYVVGELKTGYLNDEQEGIFKYENVIRVEARDDRLGKFKMVLVSFDDLNELIQTGAFDFEKASSLLRFDSENKIRT